MPVRAGFAEVDITPPLGAHKIGWLRDLVADTILDPLHARVALFESDGSALAFVQLDTLSIRWTQTQAIRERVRARYGFPGEDIMVAATHNHAGPAIANCGEVLRDEANVEALTAKVVRAFGEALDSLREAELGFGSGFEFDVAHNRRVVLRDGTVRTHGNFDDPGALFLEGPIDPEVAVLAARDRNGALLGAVVNFSCHPTHHGGGTALSAGFPGVLAQRTKEQGCPVTLYLNGACGNLHTANPTQGGRDMSMEDAGSRLAHDALGVIANMKFRPSVRLASRRRSIPLPYRKITPEEIAGTVRGAQRFVDPAIYDRQIPALIARINERKVQPAEVQVHFLDECAYVSLPAEVFVESGLAIKQAAHPAHALMVTYANGQIGYVPHAEAFSRGGYETTFLQSSRMAPETGELLAACARDLIREQQDLAKEK